VNQGEFVAGTLVNGISLNELMEALGPDSFASTQRHFLARPRSRINLRGAYARKPAVQLTPQSTAWLNERLQKAFNRYGTVPPAQLATLDWPAIDLQSADLE
jgi:hypothetical protein